MPDPKAPAASESAKESQIDTRLVVSDRTPTPTWVIE